MSEEERPDIPPGRPRLKKLRLLLILTGLSLIALVSTVFGMMMAVASDLPALENRQDLAHARNSVLLDVRGRRLGILTSAENRILVQSRDIPAVMRNAIISIEDRRFYTNSGVDIQGIGRAFVQDVLSQRASQGASTIAQQFVKNALRAQNRRTIFQKLREAALAYHLTKRWGKDKILTEYLNSIYFGNGAYGIESAARTYFGRDINHLGCGTEGHPLCVTELKPWEAAFLAGVVSSPSAYDPVSHPVAALDRRNLVLKGMLAQHYIGQSDYEAGIADKGPAAALIKPPTEQSVSPSVSYFTTWVKQQVVDRYGPQVAFDGGLRIRTTLDLDLQRAAEEVVSAKLSDPTGPTASLVAIDNQTGEVRAMVGGRDFKSAPFNLATQGQRQPGSSFKPFVLAEALRRGISPDSVWPSRKRVFAVPNGGGEKFVVRNYEGTYVGSQTLASATTFSDNSVYAAVGIKAGVGRIANLAQQMGIRTPVSHNYAITLGGLKQGVTPLDMAHAYETLAHGGQRVWGSLAAPDRGPVGLAEVQGVPGRGTDVNHTRLTRVLSPGLVDTETSILQTVVDHGTGTAAGIGQFAAGKTGTTENYGDAWFVGFTHRMTVAVWVGYPNRLRPMKTDYHGSPVAGGTYPAEIWHDFMTSALSILADRDASKSGKGSGSGSGTSTTASGATAGRGSGPRSHSGGPSSGGGTTRQRSGPSSGAPSHTPSAPTPSALSHSGGGGTAKPGGGAGGGGGRPSPAPAPSSGSPGGSGGAAGPTGGAGAQ